jgi:hypothetical protein
VSGKVRISTPRRAPRMRSPLSSRKSGRVGPALKSGFGRIPASAARS